MTSRQQIIHDWISKVLPNADLNCLEYIQSDASQRKYIRLCMPQKSVVIMDTKPDQELLNFSQLAKILAAHKITVPEIIHCNLEQGLLLMNDLGNKTYMDELRQADPARIDSLYLDAITSIIKIQQIATDSSFEYNLCDMDSEYIRNRLEVFSTWYLQKHLGIELDTNVMHIIHRMQDVFNTAFAAVPQVLVHVDYHCRNLMVLPANNPGILDFQDAMRGPITYDLVSLLQDAYISWPRSQVEGWVDTYREMAITAGIISDISSEQLLRNFDLVGLQRHIKNLGIFARLHHRDQKSNYLNDIPMLQKYIQETCTRYPELDWLLDFIAEEVQG